MQKDLTGMKFGKLLVIKQLEERSEHGHVQWICKCDCGNYVTKLGVRLRSGKAKSCGCIKRVDLVGQKFGRLTVIKSIGSKNQQHIWLCKCECGKETISNTNRLKSGWKRSCGCIQKEQLAKRNKENAKHGLNNHPLHGVWHNMKDRCYRELCSEYQRYGGRGITVCDEWLHDFQAFYDWAITHGYTKGLTIDRIDNDGNYEPNNCRWATQKEQQNNRSTNHHLTYNGKTMTISEWADELSVPAYMIRNRVKKGMPIEKILYKGDLRKKKE